jgi:hypothetical protein
MTDKMQSIATQQFDAYGDMQVPFDVATWCRAHKFNTTAVDILRTLKARNALSGQIEQLERQRDEQEERLRILTQEARQKMEVAHAV